MISRLLIANRGEIAVRIARTAANLGIETVGIYSEPDADALHVDRVDVAVALGGSTPAESYLRIDAVLAAAVEGGCDAVHPGYGFLAENAAFARAVIDAGLIWVGPTPEQIELLGDKVAAKKAAVDAGVPTTPIVEASPDNLPDDISLPALVKAAAGGGGRGMRIVRSADELADAVTAAAREAESAFGDPSVFIEPYLEGGRHIEVQILGDTHGNIVHLGERECSIQRRNQKVIEETPSPGIDDDVRATLGDAALALARHVGYVGAGTVEFMVAGSVGPGGASSSDQGSALVTRSEPVITFLEVNTRLQVEHPVTEAVTGLDLVELQLQIAAGEPLPFTQERIHTHGHAIEVRLVAEDPAAGWLPSTGTLTHVEIGAGVRVDTGVRAGSVVSADYDSLLAKVIVHAPDRVSAARRLARALRVGRVAGLSTNVDMLVATLGDVDFLDGATPTSYLDDHPDVVAARGPEGDDRLALLLATVVATDRVQRAADPVTGFAPSGWRNLRTLGQRQTWLSGDEATDVEFTVGIPGPSGTSVDVAVGEFPAPTEDGTLSADDRRRPTVVVRSLQTSRSGPGYGAYDGPRPDQNAFEVAIEIDGVRRRVFVDLARGDDGELVAVAGSNAGAVTWRQAPRFVDHSGEAVGSGPVSPLPGTVLSVHVEVGQTVSEGDLLVVVEAMKMEHKIVAVGDGVVTGVPFAAGDRVDAGDLLVEVGSVGPEGPRRVTNAPHSSEAGQPDG